MTLPFKLVDVLVSATVFLLFLKFTMRRTYEFIQGFIYKFHSYTQFLLNINISKVLQLQCDILIGGGSIKTKKKLKKWRNQLIITLSIFLSTTYPLLLLL